jgi:glycosyltransferase involved in cell wall biosynthesis
VSSVPSGTSRPLIGALILTHNEEANIGRTLAGLQWLERILVIDSGSTDATLAILADHPAVEILHRPFDSFAGQCNFGLERLGTTWALSLDADYVVTPALAAEITAVMVASQEKEGDPASGPGSSPAFSPVIGAGPPQPPHTPAGYAIPFRYCIAGRPVRGSLLPPRTCLYRTDAAHYRDDGHGHRVEIIGTVGSLCQPLLHDDRKPLVRWLASQQRYMGQEADKLLSTPTRRLSAADRLRRHTPLAPLAALLLCLVARGGVLDGWYGWAYALQRCYAELLLLLILIDRRLVEAPGGHADNGPARRDPLGPESRASGSPSPP